MDADTNKIILRSMEFEILVTEAQIVWIEVQGMKSENEQQKLSGQKMTYLEDAFHGQAEKLRKITEKMRAVARA